MTRFIISLFVSLTLLIFLCPCGYTQETLTVTTYYPSPYGVYQRLVTEELFLGEDATNNPDRLIAFDYPDTTYDGRLRITAGLSDTGNNNQGACIDLHGNARGGGLDLVAGEGSFISFWTSPTGTGAQDRMYITADGNVGIGEPVPAASIDIKRDVNSGGDPVATNKWFQARGYNANLNDEDAGRMWAQYGPQQATLLVLSDQDDPSRIKFQQVGSQTQDNPQYSSWIGLAGQNTSDIAIMGGNVGIGTTTCTTSLTIANLTPGGGSNLVIDPTTGALYYFGSSRKYKRDIKPLKDDFSKILKASPKTFTFKATGEKDIGYIAEDFEELGLSKLLTYKDGAPDAIKYDMLSIYILEIIKEQQLQIENLRVKNQKLEDIITKFEPSIGIDDTD